jgi:hypothetical protein
MFYYKFKNKLIFSQVKQNGLEAVDEQELIDSDAMIYYLLATDP